MGHRTQIVSWIIIAVIVAAAFAIHPHDKNRALLLALGLVAIFAAVLSFRVCLAVARELRAAPTLDSQIIFVMVVCALCLMLFTFSAAYILVPSFTVFANGMLPGRASGG